MGVNVRKISPRENLHSTIPSMRSPPPLPCLGIDDPFPDVAQAWPASSPAPGLLAAGADLSLPRLLSAYQRGIFPWFNPVQAILWFSTNPRMVLRPSQFQMHHALRKPWRRLHRERRIEFEFDRHFQQVMQHCAQVPRARQTGTWIGPDMIEAYTRLHQAGHALCITTHIDGQLAGGLYAVILGRMVFGESMFTLQPNGSKLALAALVAWARHHDLPLIDCQQDTAHLRSFGAVTLSRGEFLAEMTPLLALPSPARSFSPILWSTTHFDAP